MTDGRCNSDVVYGDIIAWQGSFHSIVLVLVRVLETERGDMKYWRKQYGGEERRGGSKLDDLQREGESYNVIEWSRTREGWCERIRRILVLFITALYELHYSDTYHSSLLPSYCILSYR